jgi:hypothetical protein
VSPSERRDVGIAYDFARREVLLFGGYDGGVYFGDTWAWDGAGWTEQAPARSPPGRTTMGTAYDAAGREVVLFGGAATVPSLRDTWTWDGDTWTRRGPEL